MKLPTDALEFARSWALLEGRECCLWNLAGGGAALAVVTGALLAGCTLATVLLAILTLGAFLACELFVFRCIDWLVCGDSPSQAEGPGA